MTVFSYDGARVRRLTSDRGFFAQAHVHPNGETAVCWGGEAGEARLWVAATDGSGCEAIGSEGARHPVYDPAGGRVAFSRLTADDPIEAMGARAASGMPPAGVPAHICVLDLASGAVRQITDGASQDQRPCWGSDGSTLVYVSDGRLRAVAVDGGESTDLGGPSFAYRPWFAVDGRELFFFTVVDGRRQVQRMATDGGRWNPLDNDDRGHTHGPFADPSGDHLIVHSTREGGWWLFELPLDGGPARRLDLPGVDVAAHGTRSRGRVLVFDGIVMA